ncbi:L-seryl-tRNA(Sec) selenium transferase [Listeria floridensis FSL S10-1187]|uniref:L-seryl-tRNA(Sec) selenium transferase n=1 Tax=Listeria floridensis FSL S10-1187 TaxID=1265817 RepID=A0ABN0RHT1_9LIST|nr:DgaE family pyridoxal phosphate-dependent ammonia lyase [Listeria floridensis]EUJ33419.1 L-seryl-tRNA(Sec) selenium transferase [Listeria floridensis FSL S10-1187]
MTMDIYQKYDLKKVINASGKMTILGVSKTPDETVALQKFGGQNFFEMDELVKKTGSYLASLLKTEDAVIVSSASAGIAQSVAAFIGRGSTYHLYHPYASEFTKRDIILPKGHNVDYGTAVEVMVELGGGKVREAGYANMCSKEHVEMMITEQTAALLYIKSHHTVQKSMLTVEEMVEVSQKYHIPLIVDAAAEEDLHKYTKAGADVVIYSGAKAIDGPTSGMVIGKREAISWIRMQSKGIGRAMKIGKENIIAFTGAVERYLTNSGETGEAMRKRLEPFIESLNQIEGVAAKEVQDAAGREIYRASVKVNNAKTVIAELKKENPAIYTREYQANNGIIEFDVRAVDKTEMNLIVKRLKEIMEGENKL